MSFLVWLFAKMSQPARVRLGRFVGAFIFHVLRIRRRLGDRQLAMCFPDWSAAERRRVLKACYQNLATTVIEGGLLHQLAQEGPRTTLPPVFAHEGFENFEKARALGKGTLIVTAHIGNWELLGVLYSLMGVKLNIVARDIKNKSANKLWISLRESSGLKQISAKRRQGGLKQMLQALKNNEGVAIVLDQNMAADKGVFVQFFGKPACTLDLVAVLAKRTGAAVVVCFTHRRPDGTHYTKILPPLEWEFVASDDPHADVVHNTQRYTSLIEAAVREHPEQWLWLHRRWKVQPDGKPPLP
ncbi:MAG: lysophospholipid acyltransferase family protein [Deltaproteobacteria bacterium]|nr:lysophospholipid acyltransferase family protein [Deltaproteobacteria bacterium]